jgi:putative heme-binding domain-containing protein
LALADPAELVRQAAAHSAGLWRDLKARPQLVALLESSSPPLQRAVAEALGRIGDKTAVPALLRVSAQPHDRILEHSLIYALIEIADSAGTAVGLQAQATSENRAALIALDQMDQGDLNVGMVAPLLSASDPALRRTAVWVAGHHPDWGNELADFFKDRLQTRNLGKTDADELERQLAQFAQAKPIQDIISSRLCDENSSLATRQLLVDAIAISLLKEPPPDWVRGVINCIAAEDEHLVRSAVAAARALCQGKTKPPELFSPLLKLAHDSSRAADLRLSALAALPPGSVALDPELLSLLSAILNPAKPVFTRGTAADVLAKSRLSDDQLLTLADTVKTAGPLEMMKLLESFAQSTNEAVGTKLLTALEGSKSLASLRPDTLQKVLAHFPPAIQSRGKEIIASLEVDTAKQSARLEELMASLGKGDIRRGQAIFNSQRAACSTCHAMGYLGGHVGPDLTTIGQIRTERDLLESIVFPSASFVRSFEPYVVKTKSDNEYSGVLKKDAPDELVLATGPSTEVHIARSDILDIRPGTVSVMPAGLDQQLTHQELADLIAFLKATKWGAQ